eukprot:scaffold3422_cov298-Prasinococcus_capsulatus_cf.AAC.5
MAAQRVRLWRNTTASPSMSLRCARVTSGTSLAMTSGVSSEGEDLRHRSSMFAPRKPSMPWMLDSMVIWKLSLASSSELSASRACRARTTSSFDHCCRCTLGIPSSNSLRSSSTSSGSAAAPPTRACEHREERKRTRSCVGAGAQRRGPAPCRMLA